MPAGFPDCPGCQRCLFPALNVDCGFPDCPSLNLLSFAIGFALSSFVRPLVDVVRAVSRRVLLGLRFPSALALFRREAANGRFVRSYKSYLSRDQAGHRRSQGEDRDESRVDQSRFGSFPPLVPSAAQRYHRPGGQRFVGCSLGWVVRVFRAACANGFPSSAS